MLRLTISAIIQIVGLASIVVGAYVIHPGLGLAVSGYLVWNLGGEVYEAR